MNSNNVQILVECLLIYLHLTSFFEPVLSATCFLDLIHKHFLQENHILTESKYVQPVVTSIEKSKDSITKNDMNPIVEMITTEIFKEEIQESFYIPIAHDIDDVPPQLSTSTFTKPNFLSDLEYFEDTKVHVKGGEWKTNERNWNFLSNHFGTFLSGSFSGTSVAAFACLLLFAAFLHCSLELYSLRQKISAVVKNETQIIRSLKERETQTCTDILSLRDEISSVSEMAKIFSHIKMLSIKMKSLDSTREDAERYLTDEILHLIAHRIVRVEFMKSNIDMLYPDILLRLGKIYEKFVNENSIIETTITNNADGDNLRTLKINLGVLIDKSGVIKEANSQLEES